MRHLWCHDGYCTNEVEGMNYSSKHSSISSKPCNSLKASAASMTAHAEMKMREKTHQLLADVTQTPLYIDFEHGGHNHECLRAIRPIATYMIISQFKQKDFYNIIWLHEKKFLVFRASPSLAENQSGILIFKGPPKFCEVHQVDVVTVNRSGSATQVLVCSCGLKERYGVVYRHLLAIEPRYDLGDISSRW